MSVLINFQVLPSDWYCSSSHDGFLHKLYWGKGIIHTTLLRVINRSRFVILQVTPSGAWFVFNCSCHQHGHLPPPRGALFMLLPVEQKEQVVKSLPEFSTKAWTHQVSSNWQVLSSQCTLNQQLLFLKINWHTRELLNPSYPKCGGICSGFVTRDTTIFLRKKSSVVVFFKKIDWPHLLESLQNVLWGSWRSLVIPHSSQRAARTCP